MEKKKKYIFLIICILLFSLFAILYLNKSLYTGVTSNEKVVYFTFDDGPSKNVTPKILDILKEKGVKATFFVVGYKIKGEEEILKRISDEGHGIGLHTFTHNYKTIYRSNDEFINEMDKTAEEVKRVTGLDSKIIRFPSGSKKHINDDMALKLKNKGYVVFDWNTCVSDGLNYRLSPQKLYKEAIKINPKFTRIVLLLHCDTMNANTVTALPNIIDYYKNQGYTFKIIDSSTAEYRFR